MRLSAFDPESKQLFAGMQAKPPFVRSCDQMPISKQNIKFTCAMQDKAGKFCAADRQHITKPDTVDYKACFEREYKQLFARTVAGMEIEITVWSVNAYTEPPEARPVQQQAHRRTLEITNTRPF